MFDRYSTFRVGVMYVASDTIRPMYLYDMSSIRG